MATAFETFVNDELPNRIATQEASQSANYFPRYTGTAKLTTERSPAQVLADIGAASSSHASTHLPSGSDSLNLLGFFNGTFIESFDALVTSNGTVITMSIEKSGGGDLTYNFSSGQGTFDCTPAATIGLTAGTDTVPVLNRVYILESAPTTLVKSTGGWPSAEHIRIGVFLIPSATFVQTYGAYTNQNLNDHASDTSTGLGHLAHISERLRNTGSIWISGCQGVATVDTAETPDAVWVSMTAGVVAQLHRHTFAALDSDPAGADDIILVINQSGTPFDPIQNLADLTNDSTGSPLGANKYFAVVLWAVINKTGEFSPMGINLPSGTYNTLSDAQQDLQGHTDYSRPSGFGIESTLGFLVARFILKNSANMTVEDTLDLRGDTPQTVGGGGGAGDVVAAAVLTDNAVIRGDGGAKGVQDSGVLIDDSDVLSVPGIGDGGLTSYDLNVGDVTTPDYGMIRFGNAVIGRTSYNVGSIDLDGAILYRNIGGPVTSEIEHIFTESVGNTCRFALPKSGPGNATYNPRSMLIAGPAPADTDFVKVSYWQGQGIFDNIACDTAGSGADLGVQNDLEVEGTIYADTIVESTTAAGVTVDGRHLSTDGAKLDGIEAGAAADQNLFATVGTDSGSVAASSPTSLLQVFGGTGISTSVTAGQIFIAVASPTMTALSDDATPELGGNLDVGTQYVDWAEIAAPANPAADVARMYCKDDGGTTKLFFRDSAGTETEMGGTGGGAGQLSDLSDVGVTTPTDGNVLRADGDSWESTTLALADLGDVTGTTGSGTSVVLANNPTISARVNTPEIKGISTLLLTAPSGNVTIDAVGASDTSIALSNSGAGDVSLDLNEIRHVGDMTIDLRAVISEHRTLTLINTIGAGKAHLDVEGDIAVGGTVDGRDVAADGGVLDTALQADGTIALTADWDAGGFEIRAQTFESDVVTGTAPLTIASTTLCTNLNADLLDGNHASAFATSGHTHQLTDLTDVNSSTPTAGNVLRADGVDWESAVLAAADLSNGVTGSGSVVLATSPTITTPVIRDGNGNELLEFQTTLNAVNYIDMVNAGTGEAVAMRARGDDADIALHLQSRGVGVVQLRTLNEPILIAAAVASAVNEITITNAATGNPVPIEATGGDTDISMKLVPKGAGSVILDGEVDCGAHSLGFTLQTVTYSSGTTTVDWKLGNKAKMIFGAGNIGTFAFTNPGNTADFHLTLIQDGTGGRTVTAWDADIIWANKTVPVLSTAANGKDLLAFYWDGTNYWGMMVPNFGVP